MESLASNTPKAGLGRKKRGGVPYLDASLETSGLCELTENGCTSVSIKSPRDFGDITGSTKEDAQGRNHVCGAFERWLKIQSYLARDGGGLSWGWRTPNEFAAQRASGFDYCREQIFDTAAKPSGEARLFPKMGM
uniref:Uncharacterized protein n=1 Tax=Coccidioides posadasii RMSCC 3488 TaxID=454284 RepID=A0A0J6FEU3_COCPO|nr:hypothetical protein CPAG_07959 [Coccidioides posadasii RMSCC 3488]